MYKFPEECPETLEHALIHIKEITNSEKVDGLKPDVDQIYHDAAIAMGIISNIIEKSNILIIEEKT